jgi:tripeptidyl-peptidase-2
LDTGVDPGAIGLQTAPDGRPKIVDIIDCSGSGDVIMQGPVAASEHGTLVGQTGRLIKINQQWQNPKNEWWIGSKVC